MRERADTAAGCRLPLRLLPPSPQLQPQLQSTAEVLEVQCCLGVVAPGLHLPRQASGAACCSRLSGLTLNPKPQKRGVLFRLPIF